MLQEVPCRDTDPDPGLAMDIKVNIKVESLKLSSSLSYLQ